MSTKFITINPGCHPVLQGILENWLAGSISYACSVCGKGVFDRPGEVCSECLEPEAA
jgi:hypothetical protein